MKTGLPSGFTRPLVNVVFVNEGEDDWMIMVEKAGRLRESVIVRAKPDSLSSIASLAKCYFMTVKVKED